MAGKLFQRITLYQYGSGILSPSRFKASMPGKLWYSMTCQYGWGILSPGTCMLIQSKYDRGTMTKHNSKQVWPWNSSAGIFNKSKLWQWIYNRAWHYTVNIENFLQLYGSFQKVQNFLFSNYLYMLNSDTQVFCWKENYLPYKHLLTGVE